MTKNLIIIGGGEFGREVYNFASQAIEHGAPWRIKGFLDSRPHVLQGFNYTAAILGTAESYPILEEDVFIGAIGDPIQKVKYYSPIAERGGIFVNVIHPQANIGKNVKLGRGIVMSPYTSITCDAVVGDHVSFGAFSNAGHDTQVGDWSQISSHCAINGGVTIEKGAFLGCHSCLVPKITIGSGSYIGAGSVVIKSVPDNTKVFGNPAMTIGSMP